MAVLFFRLTMSVLLLAMPNSSMFFTVSMLSLRTFMIKVFDLPPVLSAIFCALAAALSDAPSKGMEVWRGTTGLAKTKKPVVRKRPSF